MNSSAAADIRPYSVAMFGIFSLPPSFSSLFYVVHANNTARKMKYVALHAVVAATAVQGYLIPPRIRNFDWRLEQKRQFVGSITALLGKGGKVSSHFIPCIVAECNMLHWLEWIAALSDWTFDTVIIL
jgi:hypothetical protein